MKAVIKLDVPKWQIGQEVSVHFPDTAVKKAICEKNSDEIIKINDEIIEINDKIISLNSMILDTSSTVIDVFKYAKLLNICIEKLEKIVNIQQKVIEELLCNRYGDK